MNTLERALFYAVRGSAVFLPVITVAGIVLGISYAGLAVVFGFYFLVEIVLVCSGLGVNNSAANEFNLVHPDHPGFLERRGVEIYAILHLIALPVGLVLLCRPGVSIAQLAGGMLSLGVMAGSVGGLAGHEFIHRRARLERLLGIAVYGSVSYAHFTVSHLYGHHRNVGLEHDWSTSRRNESSYRFLARAFFHGYAGAWELETKKLRKRGLTGLKFAASHFMVRVTLATIALNLAVLTLLGARGWIIYAVISLLAFTLMEMVNYLSHYGLGRQRAPSGGLEPVTNRHSWESNNKVTNWFIFNAGKHCHHHRDPYATHDQLRLAHEGDYIPFGLPLMTLIAFVPWAYFRLMNPLLDGAAPRPKPRRARAVPARRRAART